VSTQPDFDLAYARFFAPIKAKCLRLLSNGQAADDVTQEVFLRMWQWRTRPALDAPEGARTILAWLYRTSTRLAIDALRERRRVVHDPADFANVPCAVDAATAFDARAAVAALVGAVRDEELHAAVLCRIDGLSQPEAALVLETSERSVRRLLTRFDERIEPVRKEFAS
jgi:RNA polymerase sigma-70 factor (ECF subfamily)